MGCREKPPRGRRGPRGPERAQVDWLGTLQTDRPSPFQDPVELPFLQCEVHDISRVFPVTIDPEPPPMKDNKYPLMNYKEKNVGEERKHHVNTIHRHHKVGKRREDWIYRRPREAEHQRR
uniref:Uncharacterized protein n=1 Tax=Setaria italica TaxID=4555 RepID=K3XU40_SETIT